MRSSLAAVTLALAASLLVGGCADEAVPPAEAAGLSERYPDDTATDWVTYSDHVVVATVVAEREVPLEGAGSQTGTTVGREVSLHLDEVVWSAEEPARGAPEGRFPLMVLGWTLDDGEKTPKVTDGSPRLEVGHTYILALFWESAVPDDPEPVPAHWNTLGLDSILPFDGGVIGAGEVAGAQVSPSESPEDAGADHGEATLGEELAGLNIDALEAALDGAEPEPPEDS
jgi:hypothetical protein